MTTSETTPIENQSNQLKNVKTSDGIGCLIIIALVLGGINFKDRLDRIEKRQQEILDRISAREPAAHKPDNPDGSAPDK